MKGSVRAQRLLMARPFAPCLFSENDPGFRHLDQCELVAAALLPLGHDQALSCVAPVARRQLGRLYSHPRIGMLSENV